MPTKAELTEKIRELEAKIAARDVLITQYEIVFQKYEKFMQYVQDFIDRRMERDKKWAEKIYYENPDILQIWTEHGTKNEKITAKLVYEILGMKIPAELKEVEMKT